MAVKGMKSMTSKGVVEQPEAGRRQRQQEEREARAAEAMAATEARIARNRPTSTSVVARVKAAQKVLDRPLARARELLDNLSPSDLQLYLLAEELDKNRKGVLMGFPSSTGTALRAQYEQESGPAPLAADSKE